MPKEMKQVIATRKGLKGGRIIQAGEIFEVEVGEKSKWYTDVKSGGQKNTDTNSNGKLDKEEILKWFEENNLQVDASLGVAALRKAYDTSKAELESKSQQGTDNE